MRNIKKDTRGQFAVIAALLIAVLTLSLVLSINQISLNRQEMSYEPVQELVLGITSDFDRCLSHALSIATHKYQEDREIDPSTGPYGGFSEGEKFIFKWSRSVIAAYSPLGINMTMESNGRKPVNWYIEWSSINGISQVYTTFYLDIDGYGFKGWVGKAGRHVSLKIDPNSITFDEHSTTLNFTIEQSRLSDSKLMPINNLTPDSLNRSRIHIKGNFWIDWNNGLRINSLKYLGGGKYMVIFNKKINKHTLGVELTVNTPEDNIIVSALNRRDMAYKITLQSQNVNSQFPDTEGKGLVKFEGVNYTLPLNLTLKPEIEYRAKYYPDSDFKFEYCTVTENIVKLAAINSEIVFIVDGEGTLTFFYSPLPKFIVNLDSRQENGLNHHLGNITLGESKYALPKLNVTIKPGTYPIEYENKPSYYFSYWEWNPIENFIVGSNLKQSTSITILGNGNITAVYRTIAVQPRVNVTVILQSREKTYLEPTCVENARTNLGQIKIDDIAYALSNVTNLSVYAIYRLEYIPADGYEFLNWTTVGNIRVVNPTSQVTSLIVDGSGTLTAFYSGCRITLSSRQFDNSTFNLGLIILGKYQPPYLNWTYTGIARGNYLLQYVVKNSSYQFQWWEFTENVLFENSSKPTTTVTIFGDADLIAVYSFISRPPPPIAGQWGTLYLAKNPSLLGTDDAMIIPFDLLPNSYWTGKEGTLPIPPKPSWQYLYINSPKTPENLFLAPKINVSLYIQLATGKADNITIELSFKYGDKKYVIGSHTFYNLVGEGWYDHQINTAEIDKTEWPYPNSAIIPEGSTITIMIAIPPNSGTLHIIWSEEKPSRIELF